ncbi:hypothetical protein BH20ACT17_BH20ACT17_02690 [soil metagenome]
MTELAELLARRFTVIDYDRRGRGDSGDTAPYAVEREIEDLDAVIDAAGGSAFAWCMSAPCGRLCPRRSHSTGTSFTPASHSPGLHARFCQMNARVQQSGARSLSSA